MSKKLDYNTKYWNATAREAKLENARFAKDAARFSKCVQFLVEKRNGLMVDLIEFGRYVAVAMPGDSENSTKFAESDAIKALPKAEQQLVAKQERVMNQLVDVLDKRIGAAMKREEDAMLAAKKPEAKKPECCKKCDDKCVKMKKARVPEKFGVPMLGYTAEEVAAAMAKHAEPAPKKDVKKPVAKKASK